MPAYRTADATTSAYQAVAVTPNDSTVLRGTRALFVGTTGDVSVTFAEGGTVTLKNISSGTLLPIQVITVRSTGTTATDLVAFY